LKRNKGAFKQRLLADKKKPLVFAHPSAFAAGEKNPCHIGDHHISTLAPL
jgi:hypothetical protein